MRVSGIESERVSLGSVTEREPERVAEAVQVKEAEPVILWLRMTERLVVEEAELDERLALSVDCEDVREQLWDLNV